MESEDLQVHPVCPERTRHRVHQPDCQQQHNSGLQPRGQKDQVVAERRLHQAPRTNLLF